MGYQSWCFYLTLVVAATATPGPAVLYITTTSGLYGWRRATFAALGNITGLLCLGLVAVTGLGTLLTASRFLFDLVRYAGALYLFYMGIRLFFSREANGISMDGQGGIPVSGWKIFLHAFGVAVGNPKAIVFLTALFPQFIDPARGLACQFCPLISVLMLFSFGFLMGYACLAHRVRGWLGVSRRMAWARRASGSIFMGFGILVAGSSHS